MSQPRGRLALVYAGAGTDARCVAAVQQQLRFLALAWRLQVRTVDAAALARGACLQQAALLCVPGGRDLPYLWALRGQACAHVRAFVRRGGRYFGSCAGAYFASEQLDFAAPQVPAVRGFRPLGLFAGQALGPSQRAAAFRYSAGEGAAGLRVNSLACFGKDAPSCTVFNRGGCCFAPRSGRVWPALARTLAFGEVQPRPSKTSGHLSTPALPTHPGTQPVTQPVWAPVALLVRLGRGKALLWGAHPELPLACKQAPSWALARRGRAPRLLRQHLAALLA